MRIDIMTLFPDYVDYILSESIIGRARKAGKLSVNTYNIRDWSEDKHRRVDDTPYGGGRGMLMAAPPIYRCYKAIEEYGRDDADGEKPYVIYMSPKGRTFNESIAKELATHKQLVILCGHYEGVDQRVIDEIVDEEISIGDFVLTGGELPAMAVADAVCRMVPGVLAERASFEDESHFSGVLEYPQYTRPEIWHDRPVPEILLSGHHENIDKWRRKQSLLRTQARRPDLYRKLELTKQDLKLLSPDSKI